MKYAPVGAPIAISTPRAIIGLERIISLNMQFCTPPTDEVSPLIEQIQYTP
jgi:hypothetical protein